MFLRLAGLAALIWAAFAMPALAADVRCVWDKLPADVHDKAFASFRSEDDNGAPFTDEQLATAARACGVDEGGFDAAGGALFGLTAQLVAEADLSKTGVTVAELDALWRTVDPKEVALMAQGIEAGSDGPRWDETVDLVRQTVQRFQRQLGDRADTDPLISYITGRAMQVSFEARP